jgi:putative NADH-flavin reductase
MKILLIGGSGNIGQRIVKEALQKGYSVNSVQRNPDKLSVKDPNLTITKGDILNKAELEGALKDADVVVSAISPHDLGEFKQAYNNLIDAMEKNPDKRIIIVGGAASTEIAPGLRLIDSPEAMEKTPKEWHPAIHAHVDVLGLFKVSNTNWTYFSPAMIIEAGERTGKYRLGGTNMIFDAAGNSHISYEDYAVALVDEIANPKHLRQQMSIAY